MKTTLLIMAAGIGSRFGGGIKQLAPVGIHGEIIMDYSVHDAICAGFNKIIFVIRKEIEKDFRDQIGSRMERICAPKNVEIHCVFQDMNDIPEGFEVPQDRVKPWGTGQAVLAAKELLQEPFAVINADDYYGKRSFTLMHDWLVLQHQKTNLAMVGFMLKDTLSENGSVTRGICKVAPSHTHLLDIVETKGIVKTPQGPEADGMPIAPDTFVSMNMWGFPAEPGCKPNFLSILERKFVTFFEKDVAANPMTSEFLLPIIVRGLLMEGECSVKMLKSPDKWFGMTYQADIPFVVSSFRELIEAGVYRESLYEDL